MSVVRGAMDCAAAREAYLGRLLAGDPASTEVDRHLAACAACREELAGLAATWTALETLRSPEPPAAVARRLRRRLRWAVAMEGLRSRERWERAAARAVLGFLLSVLLSLALPYDLTVALCRELLRALLPTPAAYALAGLLYGLIPMAAAAAWRGRRDAAPETLGALQASLLFVVLLLPYAVARCGDFPLPLLAGFLLGMAAGSAVGATGGARLSHRRGWA